MEPATAGEITDLLIAWSGGEQAALDKLVPLIHYELYRIARHYMRGESEGHTLQTTALLNEAYLRLIDEQRGTWRNRTHFFAASAQVMRRILVDHARFRRNLKRGGDQKRIPLDESLPALSSDAIDLIALDQALDRLADLHGRQTRVLELRYFGGLSEGEIAEILDISLRTVRQDWSIARAWLYRELSGQVTERSREVPKS